jgi:PASTA domain-containing protein
LKSSRFCKLAVSLVVVLVAGFASAATASADKVLLFGPSVDGGASSVEGQQAAAQGFGVDVADAAAWSSMTTAQFAAYRAIVIGDNHDSGEVSDLSAAEANAGVWGAAVNGNVIVTGADPEYHADPGAGGDPGAVTYISRGVEFAAGSPTQTGAYIALDGYYNGGSPEQPAKVLDGFGQDAFGMVGEGSDDIHIDPAVSGPSALSDSILSDWGDTTHSYFSRYPTTFKVWAIGVDPTGPYTTSDGQKGFADWIVRAAEPLPVAPTCVVPKLKGKSIKKAKKKLRNGNCKLGKKKGHGKKVTKQKPKPGTVLPEGSKVKVTVH